MQRISTPTVPQQQSQSNLKAWLINWTLTTSFVKEGQIKPPGARILNATSTITKIPIDFAVMKDRLYTYNHLWSSEPNERIQKHRFSTPPAPQQKSHSALMSRGMNWTRTTRSGVDGQMKGSNVRDSQRHLGTTTIPIKFGIMNGKITH